MVAKKLNIQRTERLNQALQTVYEQMKADGIPSDFGGKMNAAAVILYALEQTARRGGNMLETKVEKAKPVRKLGKLKIELLTYAQKEATGKAELFKPMPNATYNALEALDEAGLIKLRTMSHSANWKLTDLGRAALDVQEA